MPITDAVKNRNLLVPVRVQNKASEAVNVKIAAGSLPATISSKDLLKLQNAISGSQKVYYTKKIKQERSFLKYLGITLVGAVATGIGVYVGKSLYKKMVSKTIGKVKSDVFGTAKVAMYNVFGKALEFIKTKFASMIELVKNDFHEILGDKLGAVWDAAKGVFGWVKKIFSWWIKFFLIRFAARAVLTKYGGFSREQAVAMTKPIKFFMSKFFRFPLYFKLFGKFLGYIKDVVVVSGFLSKNFKSKVLDKIDLFKERFLSIVNSDRFQKVKALFEKLGQSKLAQTISEYASKLKGGLKALAETFGKGNTSLKDKIFSFVKSMKDSIIAKYVSMRDEARLYNQEKKLRKKEAKRGAREKKAEEAKKTRNETTKRKLKALFGNQTGTIGAQPGTIEGGWDLPSFRDMGSLILSALGLGHIGVHVTHGLHKATGGLGGVGRFLMSTTGGGLLSGGLEAARGGGPGNIVGTVGGVMGGSKIGHAGGSILGGLLGRGNPTAIKIGGVIGSVVMSLVGSMIGKKIGGGIEDQLKGKDGKGSFLEKLINPEERENPMMDFLRMLIPGQYAAYVKANMIQTKEMNRFDDKNRDKYLGIGSDVVGYLNEIWKGVLGKLTTTLGGGNAPQTVGAISGGTPSVPANASDMIKNPAYAPFIDQAIKATGRTDITPADIARLIQTESNWKPNAVSPKGAMGLMQLMPGTAGNINAMDPEQNINRGVGYYAGLLKKYNGDKEKALAAYNWGEGKLDRALGSSSAPMDRSKLPLETKKFLMETYGGPSIPAAISGTTVPQSAAEGLMAAVQQNKDLKYGGNVYCGSYADMIQKAAISAGGGDLSKYPANLGMGMPEALSRAYGSRVYGSNDLSVDFLKNPAMLGASISRFNVKGQAHRETIAQNPGANMEQQILSMGIPGQPATWTPITESSVQRLKDLQAKVTNVLPMLPGNQIADLERQKGLNTAQIQATNTAALQATAAAATSLPGEMNKNATQTNNIISQTMSSGGRSQGQQVNAFEIDDMYILGNMGLALSILNP